MRFGYEGIKNIKCGTVRLAENNKTVNKIYLDLIDEIENVANFTFSIDEAENIANQLLQLVFEHTEIKVVKNKNEITPEEWKVIDEQNWAKIKSRILCSNRLSHIHDFIKTLSVIECHDGNMLYLESYTHKIVGVHTLHNACNAIMHDSVIIDEDEGEIEIGNGIGYICISFKNAKQKEFEYSQ